MTHAVGTGIGNLGGTNKRVTSATPGIFERAKLTILRTIAGSLILGKGAAGSLGKNSRPSVKREAMEINLGMISPALGGTIIIGPVGIDGIPGFPD
jgi:hypothetical protein